MSLSGYLGVTALTQRNSTYSVTFFRLIYKNVGAYQQEAVYNPNLSKIPEKCAQAWTALGPMFN